MLSIFSCALDGGQSDNLTRLVRTVQFDQHSTRGERACPSLDQTELQFGPGLVPDPCRQPLALPSG